MTSSTTNTETESFNPLLNLQIILEILISPRNFLPSAMKHTYVNSNYFQIKTMMYSYGVVTDMTVYYDFSGRTFRYMTI